MGTAQRAVSDDPRRAARHSACPCRTVSLENRARPTTCANLFRLAPEGVGREWRNGRRARFRSVCPKGRGGSTPLSRTFLYPAPIRPNSIWLGVTLHLAPFRCTQKAPSGALRDPRLPHAAPRMPHEMVRNGIPGRVSPSTPLSCTLSCSIPPGSPGTRLPFLLCRASGAPRLIGSGEELLAGCLGSICPDRGPSPA